MDVYRYLLIRYWNHVFVSYKQYLAQQYEMNTNESHPYKLHLGEA